MPFQAKISDKPNTIEHTGKLHFPGFVSQTTSGLRKLFRAFSHDGICCIIRLSRSIETYIMLCIILKLNVRCELL